METTDEKLISEFKEYWNSGGKIKIEQFPTLKESLDKNSLDELFFIIEMNKVYNLIINNFEDKDLEIKLYYSDIIELKEFEGILKAIIPENLDSNEVNEKIKRIKHVYALDQINSFSKGKSKEKLIEILSTSFDPDILFSKDKVGFSELENRVFKKIQYMMNNSYIPQEIENRIVEAFNTKVESDLKRVMENGNFQEFIEIDKYLSSVYRYCDYFDESLKKVDLDCIKKLIDVSKKFTTEQLSQVQIFQDITIIFINTYDKYHKKGIDEIAEIFKIYLSKCKNSEDLLDKTIATIASLMNSEFLEEEDRNNLRNIYELNYLSKFQKENESRKNELQQKFPDLPEKIKNRESITAEELEIVKELACIERTTDGFLKDEYIDAILKFELEKNIDYSENNNLIKRILEDTAQRLLLDEGIKNYCVITASPDYFLDNIFDDSEMSGGHKLRNTIKINDIVFDKLIVLDILITMYHEVQHAKQFNAIESGKNTNFLIYDMAKDYNIAKYFNNSYYKANYDHIKYEVDAKIFSNIKLVEYLQNLGINDEKIINQVQKNLTRGNKLKECNLRKTDVYQDVLPVDYIFQEFVKKKSWILIFFEPFKIEFDSKTGTRKGNGEILLEYMKWCRENNLSEEQIIVNEYADYYHGNTKDNEEQMLEKASLYAHILNNDSYVNDTLVIDDMLLLPELMKTKSPKFRKMLDKIVRYEMLDVAYNYLKDGHIPEEVDMLTFVKAVSNLEEYAQNIEKGEFQEEILNTVSKIMEEVKQNEEASKTKQDKEKEEIHNLGEIAQDATVESLENGRNIIEQFLERDGKINDK